MKKKQFIFYILVTLIFFGMLYKLEYATDTYSVFNFNGEQLYAHLASLGRFVTAFIGKVLKDIQASEQTIYLSSWILAIICCSLSQYKLYTIIEKDVKKRELRLIIPTLIVINPFSIELFLFIEKGIMWLGVLLCIYALSNLKNYFETRKKKYILYATLLMFIANCSYQGIIGLFVSIALVYILKYSKNIKQFILNNVITALIYGIPAIVNYLLAKITFKANRINGEIILAESLKKIYFSTIEMSKNMYGLLPKYLFILAILFTFSVFCSKILKEKRKFVQILKYIYMIVGVLFVTVAPQIMQATNSIWFVPRSTYSFACLYGILILYLAINYEIKNIERAAFIVVSIVLIAFQFQKFIQIEKDRYIVNQKDEQITMQIIERIKEYEMKTENKVEQIAIYQDEKPCYTYSGIFATGDTNIKCYSSNWSTVAIINYYFKRDLKLVKKDEEIGQEFAKKNWDEFNNDQIIFDGNRMILCNY